VHVVRALLHQVRGDLDRALDDLSDALTVGVPVGYRRLFLDEGRPMAVLLRTLASSPAASAGRDAAELLHDGTAGSGDERREAPSVARDDELSDRELEVLRLLATGLTGPEIAQQLFVSINTLRTHTRHIFTKLDVSTRRAAVLRASELHLL
jgi:LuxR family maltose regulon positive regulatory protein